MSTPVQSVCAHITRLCRVKSLQAALGTGKHVVNHLLDGDVSKLGTSDDKHPSIRELSAMLADDHVLSPTTLWRYLGVYALFVRRDLFGKVDDYGWVVPLVGLAPAVQDELLADAEAQKWDAPTMKAKAAAKRPQRATAAPEVIAARQVKKVVGIVAGLAGLPKAARVSHVKQLEPLLDELIALWSELTGAPKATAAKPVAEAAEPEAVLGPADDARVVLAGLPAPDVDDVPAFFAERAALAPAADEGAPARLGALLDGAGDRPLELRYGPGLAAQLDLCVTAQLVLARPALAARTAVVWEAGGARVPLLEVGDVLRDVWRAFHAPTPKSWDELRGRALPPALAAAVLDWLAELPHPKHGLGATQREILYAARDIGIVGEVIDTIAAERAGIFGRGEIRRMTAALRDLGALEGLPEEMSTDDETEPLRLTDFGDGLLAGYGDLMTVEDRWWGGTRLTSAAAWRWDPRSQVLIPPSA